MQVRSCNQRYFFKPTTNLRMKLALKGEKQVIEIYTKWLLDYLNVYVTTNTSIFKMNSSFNGISVNEEFLSG